MAMFVAIVVSWLLPPPKSPTAAKENVEPGNAAVVKVDVVLVALPETT